jgi:broad specificity phosphatase PhoE
MNPKVVLIPAATTEWCEQGRLLGRAELEPSDAGLRKLAAWAEELRPLALTRIFHAPDTLSTSTARQLAGALDIVAKSDSALSEVDLGLWAGLTETELKSRYAKAHRQLRESPFTVSPPGGEEVAEAADRLRETLRKRLKRTKGRVGIVLRPLSFALARTVLGESAPREVWSARESLGPIVIDGQQAQTAVSGVG